MKRRGCSFFKYLLRIYTIRGCFWIAGDAMNLQPRTRLCVHEQLQKPTPMLLRGLAKYCSPGAAILGAPALHRALSLRVFAQSGNKVGSTPARETVPSAAPPKAAASDEAAVEYVACSELVRSIWFKGAAGEWSKRQEGCCGRLLIYHDMHAEIEPWHALHQPY